MTRPRACLGMRPERLRPTFRLMGPADRAAGTHAAPIHRPRPQDGKHVALWC